MTCDEKHIEHTEDMIRTSRTWHLVSVVYCSVSQQDFRIGMSNGNSCWASWMCMRDHHGTHPRTVVTQTTGRRAKRASVFNCDINIFPKATTDLETTLWEGKQFCIGCTPQMLSGSRVLACYVLATHQVSATIPKKSVRIPKKSKKNLKLSITAFFPVQLTLKPRASSVYKLL